MNRVLRLNRHVTERLGFGFITFLAVLVMIPIIAVIVYIIARGAPAISAEFLTAVPREGMRAGGILPAIVGTLYLTVGTAIFSVPLGIAAAIYLAEYASDTPLTRTIRIAIINLSGIPRSSMASLASACSCCSSSLAHPSSPPR
jgi:phosphate transport system permease protein